MKEEKESEPEQEGPATEEVKEEGSETASPIENMTVEEISTKLKELTFEIKDKTMDLPMGDNVAVVKAFAPLLQDYCAIVPKVAEKVQSYFSNNQVPIEMIKACDVYYYELKRVMRKYPEILEDENLKIAVDLVVTPYEKAIKTMVDVARQYAKQRGQNYDTDY